MRDAAEVIAQLRSRGELWDGVGGAPALGGETLRRYRRTEARLARMARRHAGEDWRAPAAIGMHTLERAGYFADFPHWLTVAAHLRDDPAALERVARSDQPARAAAETSVVAAALPPAVCYHVYERLAERTIGAEPLLVTAQGTCWRHEEASRPLARGWAFTMREIVCVGTPAQVTGFRRQWMRRALRLARRRGLAPRLVPASDPFFAPTARGRALLQRLRARKHELLLPVGAGDEIAVASFNHHDRFFGERFALRLPDGAPAATGCVAFGLERWLLAELAAGASEAEPHLERSGP